MKSIECEICYFEHFSKNESITCSTCKKNICYKCLSSYLNKMTNIYIEFKCAYCRSSCSLTQITKLLNQLNKTLLLEDNLTISWNRINYNVITENNKLLVEIQDIPPNLNFNIKDDILFFINSYLKSKRLI